MDTQIATTTSRPNRVLLALAAAWMILSLAIGGAVTAGNPADQSAAPSSVTTGTSQR